MTPHFGGDLPKSGATVCAALCLLGMAALVGCASSSTQAVTGLGVRGPIDTGTYPNLNVLPESAATPITPADRARIDGNLAAAKGTLAANGKATSAQADAARLKRIAAEHGKDTLAEIEAQ